MIFVFRLIALLVFIGLIFSFKAKGQGIPENSFLKFGNISTEQLEMKQYKPDSSAEAIILYDAGKSYFFHHNGQGTKLYFDRHIKIKILKKSGYKWANVAIKLYRDSNADREVLSNFKAFTYNLEEGKSVAQKITKESILEEKNSENWVTQKFTLPQVKVGSVLEYSYRIESPFFYNFQPWTFQNTVPTLWSEYTALIPDRMKYKKVVQGYEPFYINESKKIDILWSMYSNTIGTSFHYAMKDVPGIKEEPYMRSVNNYVAKIEFEKGRLYVSGRETASDNITWAEVNNNLLTSDYFGAIVVTNTITKEIISSLELNSKSEDNKLNAIFNYVTQKLQYNGQNRIFSYTTFKKTLETGKGSVADINLFLVALLKQAGLKADPVIISTRENGLITKITYPSFHKFNYVIGQVIIGEKKYLLDATEPLSFPNMLPVRCLNGEGRLISAAGSEWVNLSPLLKSTQIYQANLDISPDNTIKGQVKNYTGGYAGLLLRKSVMAINEEKFIETLQHTTDYWETENHKIQNLNTPTENLKVEFDVILAGQTLVQNLLYIKPLQDKGLKTNPFYQQERQFPIDFTTGLDETYIFTYTLPLGYKIEEHPQNSLLTLPENNGRFSYSISVLNNTMTVVSKVAINKPVFYPEEYAALKEFFDKIIAKQAEQIVLKKI